MKTGDVQDWLRDMFGGRFWVAGDAVGWEKKIEVRYPDSVCILLSLTIYSILIGVCRHPQSKLFWLDGLPILLLETLLSVLVS